MYNIVVQPAGSSSAKHFEKSIANKIDIRSYKSCFDPSDYALLMTAFHDGMVNVWGNTNGSASSKGCLNENKWKKIDYNDVQLFVGNRTIKAYSETALTLKCKKFAEALWGTNKAGETWENLSFLKNVQLTNIPSIYLNIYFAYKYDNSFAGFMVTDKMFKGFRDTYINAYKPSPMFIENFKVVNNLPAHMMVDQTVDSLKKNIEEIKSFHKGSDFDLRTAQGSENTGKALVYDISLEIGPDDTANKDDIDKCIRKITRLLKGFDISRVINLNKLKQDLKEALYTTLKEYMANRKICFPHIIHELVESTINKVLPPNLSPIANWPRTYRFGSSIEALTSDLAHDGFSTTIIDEIVEEVLNSFKHIKTEIAKFCEDVISSNGDISRMELFPRMMDLLEKLGEQGKALKAAILELVNCSINSIVLGYFDHITGIHLYYDRIKDLAESKYKKYVDEESDTRRYDYRRWLVEYSDRLTLDDFVDAFLAKVAAHEMEHAWHYADIMTISGTYHKFDYPEVSWVSETIAEYFCYQYAKNISAKAKAQAMELVERRRTYLFPYEGGYAGALLLDKAPDGLERFKLLYYLSLYEGRYAYYYVMSGLVKKPF